MLRLVAGLSSGFTYSPEEQSEVSMLDYPKTRPVSVIGPLGEKLTMDALPSLRNSRWTIRRKAEVVAAVEGGMLTTSEACERYSLDLEELTCWRRSVDRSRMLGLRVTRIQQYRDRYERRDRY